MGMRLKLVQGSTFFKQFRWEAEPFIYKPIVAIDCKAPCIVHAPDHGLRNDQQFVIQAAKGLEVMNATEPVHLATDWRRGKVIDKDTIEINRLNSSLFKPHTPNTGNIKYRSVIDLTGYTARMMITDRTRTNVLYALSTTIGNLRLDVINQYIEIDIPPEDIAEFEWTKGVYDLELVSADGRVIKVIDGDVTVGKESTTL